MPSDVVRDTYLGYCQERRELLAKARNLHDNLNQALQSRRDCKDSIDLIKNDIDIILHSDLITLEEYRLLKDNYLPTMAQLEVIENSIRLIELELTAIDKKVAKVEGTLKDLKESYFSGKGKVIPFDRARGAKTD
jgi:chromosome segregation ATPase